ncbi:uncharacterized protein LOC116617698 [Nematostella vectensis]|uniref:uncharacterized protein LOC116617698 n=1 Tax=Nematostella vectensis TaxID=45351 RepID=UPI0020773C20|nr:uncharacterized protein LOC116617698 [Nematostella vectensis]
MSRTSRKKSVFTDQLCQVLKDHKNPCMVEFTNKSFQFFLGKLCDELGEEIDEEGLFEANEHVVRIRVCRQTLQTILREATSKLHKAGLQFDCFGLLDVSLPCSIPVEITPLSGPLAVLIKDIERAMDKLEYVAFKGCVYHLTPGATYTYSQLCTMKAFLHCLMANNGFRDRLVKHFPRVLTILGDEECRMIPQLHIERDLVEVNDGWCWSFASNQFVNNAISKSQKGHVSPRAFIKYRHTDEPNPRYFRETLQNSLDDSQIAEFLRDFLDLFRPKVHKQKVPCAIGPPDSGKTSLFAPVFQVIPLERIARVTKQKGFSKSMINAETEVIFLDEASESILDIDDWKILCQGGYTAHDAKWKGAAGFKMTASMFITCQQEMNFGPLHNAAMDKRLNKYTFKSLLSVDPEAHQWLSTHAMDCIVWASRNAAPRRSSAPTPPSTDAGLSLTEIARVAAVDLSDEDADEDCVEESCCSNTETDGDEDNHSGTDAETFNKMEAEYRNCQPFSMRKRQLNILLEKMKGERSLRQQLNKARKSKMLKSRSKRLVDLGVPHNLMELLPEDPEDAMPEEIIVELGRIREDHQKSEAEKRKVMARAAFESHWVRATETELHRCSSRLQSITDEALKSAKALVQLVSDKLKSHHTNTGTLACETAIEERRKACISWGLLDQRCAHLLLNLWDPLPSCDDEADSDQDSLFRDSGCPSQTHTPPRQGSSDDMPEIPKTPSWSPKPNRWESPGIELMAFTTPAKRRSLTQTPNGRRNRLKFRKPQPTDKRQTRLDGFLSQM